MLNIMVMNCDDVFVEYQWDSKEEFLNDLKSDNENIPMLDDAVITIDTEQKSYSEEDCRDEGIYIVADLVEVCKKI